jgi:hypothetical protein
MRCYRLAKTCYFCSPLLTRTIHLICCDLDHVSWKALLLSWAPVNLILLGSKIFVNVINLWWVLSPLGWALIQYSTGMGFLQDTERRVLCVDRGTYFRAIASSQEFLEFNAIPRHSNTVQRKKQEGILPIFFPFLISVTKYRHKTT